MSSPSPDAVADAVAPTNADGSTPGTAFVAAVISVKFMVTALGKYGLTPFGYYRILLAIVCLWWL